MVNGSTRPRDALRCASRLTADGPRVRTLSPTPHATLLPGPMRNSHLLPTLLLVILSSISLADERDRLKVGLQPDGRIVVPTNQILQPAGKQVTFPGRPVDLLLIEDGKTLVAKNMKNLVFIDAATGAVKQTLALTTTKGLSGAFSAVGLVTAGDRILATDSQNHVRIASKTGDVYAWTDAFPVKGPTGITG